MKALAIFSLLLASALAVGFTASGNAVPPVASPDLAISSVSGNLEMGRAGIISLVVQNNASADLPAPDSFGTRGSALGVIAELQSRDERLEVLSSPQVVGSLAPGENRSIEFTVRADQEIGAGIYPLELALSYSRLSDVKATSDTMPDVLFRYENADQILPIEAKVAIGPRISLEDTRGQASPGEKSEVELVFTNLGDETAENAEVKLSPEEPFGITAGKADLGNIEPGSTTSAKFGIFTKNRTIAGTYALPCRISYRYGQLERSDKLAALVDVRTGSWMGIAIPATAVLLLTAGIYLGIKMLQGKKKRLRKRY